jgi:hypothetical protein
MAKKARSPALLCPLALGGERLDGAWKGVKSEGENGVLTLLLEKEIIQLYLLITYRRELESPFSPSLFTPQSSRSQSLRA